MRRGDSIGRPSGSGPVTPVGTRVTPEPPRPEWCLPASGRTRQFRSPAGPFAQRFRPGIPPALGRRQPNAALRPAPGGRPARRPAAGGSAGQPTAGSGPAGGARPFGPGYARSNVAQHSPRRLCAAAAVRPAEPGTPGGADGGCETAREIQEAAQAERHCWPQRVDDRAGLRGSPIIAQNVRPPRGVRLTLFRATPNIPSPLCRVPARSTPR